MLYIASRSEQMRFVLLDDTLRHVLQAVLVKYMSPGQTLEWVEYNNHPILPKYTICLSLLYTYYICYDPICNLACFEASQPALKRVNPLQNWLTGFTTTSSPWAGFKAGQLTVKRLLTRFTTAAGECCTLRVEVNRCDLCCSMILCDMCCRLY